MSKGKQAKTASKNNPLMREKQKEVFYNGKKIVPIKLVSDVRSFMAAKYDDNGEIVTDAAGNFLDWGKVAGN